MTDGKATDRPPAGKFSGSAIRRPPPITLTLALVR
jgi:hypothetical protein